MTKLEQLLAANKAANKNDWRDEVIEEMGKHLRKIVADCYSDDSHADEVYVLFLCEQIAQKELEK